MKSYFEKKAQELATKNAKADKLTREILMLAYELHQVIPFDVNFSFSGHVEWVEIHILDSDLKDVWKADYVKVKGEFVDLERLTLLKKVLKEAISKRIVPKPFPCDKTMEFLMNEQPKDLPF